MIFLSGRSKLIVLSVGATCLIIYCMIFDILPVRYLSDIQNTFQDHSDITTISQGGLAKSPSTEKLIEATNSVLPTASTSLPIQFLISQFEDNLKKLDHSTYPPAQSSAIPLKRYGTYVQNINETCLKKDCVYDEKSPNIWAREKVRVKVIPENTADPFVKKNLLERVNDTDTREEFDLLLTPAIITVWAYELGFALTEGMCLWNVNFISL